MQIVQPGIQQFQMVPTGNSMLVNQQGAQVQIINHGSIAQGGQIVQSVANGQQATQIQTTQISSVSTKISVSFIIWFFRTFFNPTPKPSLVVADSS